MKEIEKIIERYQNTNWEKEKAALGTVVRVEESSYRRIGARMYVSDNGEWVGGISGGCLEGDALKRAQMAISKNESSVVIYDTMDDDSHQIGVGLGCNGRIDVMFTPIDRKDSNNPVEQLIKIKYSRDCSVLFQIIGSSEAGEKNLGKIYTENDYKILAKELDEPLENLKLLSNELKKRRKSKAVKFRYKNDGYLELLMEVIHPKVKLICIGDNYDVNSIVSIAHELGWEIHVAGKMRKLSKHVFQNAKSVCTFDEATRIELDDHTAVILMSHDFETDFGLIHHFLKKEISYLGLLGPKKRMKKIEDTLRKNDPDIDLNAAVNLFAPTGLDIGAESPEEIALSIVAEIIATMRKREGKPLKERKGPIHERD